MCTLHERITELCKEKGVTGSRMCLDLGMSKSTMSDLKSGRKKSVTAETAQKIASYLGVSVAYLLGEETEKAPSEPELTEGELAMLQLFRQIPKDRQSEALDLLRVALKMQQKL